MRDETSDGLTFHLKRIKIAAMVNRQQIREVMQELGRRGGKIGGKRAAANMTAKERRARAKKASLAAAKKRTADARKRKAKAEKGRK
jgi:hypothetical protein